MNSKSCTSLKCFSKVWRIFSNSVERLRQLIFQLRHWLGCAHAGHHVFALRVDEEFAVEHFLAGRRIARERHAGAGLVAGIAVDHRLHVDGGAPFGGNVVFAAIDNRAIIHPGTEHRADRAPELLPRHPGELLARAFLDQRLEADHKFLQIRGGKFRVVHVVRDTARA